MENKDNITFQDLQNNLDYYRENPEIFFEEFYGVELYDYQKVFLKRLFEEYKEEKFYVKSRQVGYSRELMFFLHYFYGENKFVEKNGMFFVIPEKKDKPLKVIFDDLPIPKIVFQENVNNGC